MWLNESALVAHKSFMAILLNAVKQMKQTQQDTDFYNNTEEEDIKYFTYRSLILLTKDRYSRLDIRIRVGVTLDHFRHVYIHKA